MQVFGQFFDVLGTPSAVVFEALCNKFFDLGSIYISQYVRLQRQGLNNNKYNIGLGNSVGCRSQWPRGLRLGSAAVRLLGLWVRIPPGACLSLVLCVVR